MQYTNEDGTINFTCTKLTCRAFEISAFADNAWPTFKQSVEIRNKQHYVYSENTLNTASLMKKR